MSDADGMLPDWVAHRAATSPEHVAIMADGQTLTYAALDRAVTRVAEGLHALGVGPGHRVATLLHNGLAPALLVHAVLRAGATLVPLNVRLTSRELAWQVADAAAQVLLVEDRTQSAVESVDAGQSLPIANVRDLVADAPGHVATEVEVAVAAPIAAEEGAASDGGGSRALRVAHPVEHVLAIIYTSGTTGTPKGAMLTVGNFWWSAVGSALNLGTRNDDRWLAVLPVFHVGGLSILIRSAIYGITVVIHDGFDAAAVNASIEQDRITIVSVVAVMLQRMLEAMGDRRYPGALRCVLLGGGPAPLPLLQRCEQRQVPVAQTYGLTEATSQVATLVPGDAIRKPGSAGRALYPNAVRIAAAGGSDAGAGEAGEILVRGPVVMHGYAGRPDATADAIHDGWLYTGDIGCIDDEGYLYVLDRRDDLIVSGGENVYPAEVEAVLLGHPDVVEAGVVGMADPTWGQRVVAVVRLRGQGSGVGVRPGSDTSQTRVRPGSDPIPSLPDLRAYCRTHLAGYKTPAKIRIVTEPLPRTAAGKLRRAELRARLQDLRADGERVDPVDVDGNAQA